MLRPYSFRRRALAVAAKFESFAKRVGAAQQEIWEAAGKTGTFEFEHVMGQVVRTE
jgi:hypothetical protein